MLALELTVMLALELTAMLALELITSLLLQLRFSKEQLSTLVVVFPLLFVVKRYLLMFSESCQINISPKLLFIIKKKIKDKNYLYSNNDPHLTTVIVVRLEFKLHAC